MFMDGRKEGIVPLRPLERVVIAGSNTVDTAVLHRLARNGTIVMFLSGRTLRFSGMMWGTLHNNGLLRVKQYEKSLDREFVLAFSKEIILKKINAQQSLLGEMRGRRAGNSMECRRSLDILEKIALQAGECSSTESLMGYEGAASSAYFSAFTGMFADSLGFRTRNRRPPRDPVNAMLSLCYTMIHFEAVREVQVAGLDPFIGFYHRFDYGRESLACDMVEPLRPAVDRLVLEMFIDRLFTARDFVNENGGVYLKKAARQRFYPVYEEWAVAVRQELRQEVRSLARRLNNGQDPLPE